MLGPGGCYTRSMVSLLGLEVKDLEALLGPTEPRYRARQLYSAIYRERRPDLQTATNLPSQLRDRLTSTHKLGLPGIERRYDSADGTRRYLLSLEDGRSVETVLMPEQGRNTFCISSQVGCPVACRFCLTALMGLERNLTAGEIVGQVLAVAADNGLEVDRERINIVMMGQGEPLLNLHNVIKATRILTDPDGVGLSPRRITVSTSGIIPRIDDLAREDVRPKLAISLNASNEMQRQELMPITRKYHVADLIDACRRYPLRSWERLTFEYVLLRGVNDTDADARRLAGMLGQLRCKVNLIALNPGPGIPYETPDPDRVLAFQDMVKRAVPCFIRKPRGLDIYAACGQLKRMTQS